MSGNLVYAIAREVLEQVEGGRCPETQLMVITHLKVEMLHHDNPDKIPLVMVARILATEESAFRVFPRFVTEVPGWEKFYPIALNGRLRWRKWFNIPEEFRSSAT